MKFKEIKEKSEVELRTALAALREEVQTLRFKVASRELKDVREIREKRMTIARILTALSISKKAN